MEANDIRRTDPLYPLDWEKSAVNLAKGRFSHVMSRPADDLILEREKELDFEVPINKDGSYSLPDATEQEAIDAKYAKKILVESKGYQSDPSEAHLAAAFQGLYQREIYLDEDCDIFGEELVIIEEVGAGDEPDFVMKHCLKAPDEKLLKTIRQKTNNSRVVPGKRGKQKFVQKSNLRWMMGFYEELFKTIEGATVEGAPYSEDKREIFLAFIDPFSKKEVMKVIVDELTGNLLD